MQTLFVFYYYFPARFSIYVALMMAAGREQFFVVGVSDTKSDDTFWWMTDILQGMQKKNHPAIYCYAVFGRLEHLIWVSVFFSCMYILQKDNNLVDGLLSRNFFLHRLVNTNELFDPLILKFNVIILKENHTLFHRVEIIHHGFWGICHILCCRFSK